MPTGNDLIFIVLLNGAVIEELVSDNRSMKA